MNRAIADGSGSSPHTRGALADVRRGGEPVGIIPAYAGSTRWAATCCRAWPDHPRIRGEHPGQQAPVPGPSGSSPHTRGALSTHGYDAWWTGIIPAYAGSTPPGSRSGTVAEDHPRIRGEHARKIGRSRKSAGSSPHTRGARHLLAPSPVGQRIIPAYAGSTRRPIRSRTHTKDHPRIRGEHSGAIVHCVAGAGSSPHTRGALSGI